MTVSRVVEAIPLPLKIADLGEIGRRVTKEHGNGCVMAQHGRWLLFATDGDGDPIGCWCHRCDAARRAVIKDADGATWADGMLNHMIVCPDCGNKRCPKAADHDHACTGSNEPGQPGSAY